MTTAFSFQVVSIWRSVCREPPQVLGDGSKEQTRHGRLVVHAVEADRASGTNTGLDGAFRAAPG
jgi:hypothetical protein